MNLQTRNLQALGGPENIVGLVLLQHPFLYILQLGVGQIMSFGVSHTKRVRDCIAILSMLTVRVVVLEHSQLYRLSL